MLGGAYACVLIGRTPAIPLYDQLAGLSLHTHSHMCQAAGTQLQPFHYKQAVPAVPVLCKPRTHILVAAIALLGPANRFWLLIHQSAAHARTCATLQGVPKPPLGPGESGAGAPSRRMATHSSSCCCCGSARIACTAAALSPVPGAAQGSALF